MIYQLKNSIIVHSKIKKIAYFIIGVILIILLVQFLSVLKNDKIIFPNVIEIFKAFFSLLGKKETYSLIASTLLRLLIALSIALIIGIIIGIFEGIFESVRLILKPLMVLLRSLPMIVLVVIIMVLVSSNEWENVPIYGTSIILIPIISEAVAEGIVRIDKSLLDVYKINSNLTPFVIFKVHIPLIIGYIKQAFINAIGMGIKVIVTTEYIVSATPSLGKAIYNSQYLFEYEYIYAYAILMVILVLLVEGIPILISKLYTYFKFQKQQAK